MTESNPYESPTSQGVRGACTSDSVVEFDYVLDDSIWFALRENHAQQINLVRRTQITLCILALLFLLLGIGLTQAMAPLWLLYVPIFVLSGMFIIRAVRTKHMFLKSWRKQLGRMLSSRSNEGIYGRCTVRLEPDGVKSERPAGYAFWHWWAVPEVTVAEGYLLIYTSSVEANIIPARAFATDKDFDNFVANAQKLWNERNTA